MTATEAGAAELPLTCIKWSKWSLELYSLTLPNAQWSWTPLYDLRATAEDKKTSISLHYRATICSGQRRAGVLCHWFSKRRRLGWGVRFPNSPNCTSGSWQHSDLATRQWTWGAVECVVGALFCSSQTRGSIWMVPQHFLNKLKLKLLGVVSRSFVIESLGDHPQQHGQIAPSP